MAPPDRHLLRQQILARRDAIPAVARRAMSEAVCRRLQEFAPFAAAATLFVYVNFRSEVETLALIEECLAAGKRVAVPLTDTANKRLYPYLITDLAADLRPGYCNIPEPAAERLPRLAPHEIEVVVVPGSAFDAAGGRLGYGGGYYDRFLANEAPQALRIGVAFEQQVVTEVPLAPHDQRLDILITDKRIIRTGTDPAARQPPPGC